MSTAERSGVGAGRPHGQTADVIVGLVDRLRPVRAIRLRRVIARCVLVQLGVTLGTVFLVGLRPDLRLRVLEPTFVFFISALGLAGILSSVAAMRAGVPGREPRSFSILPMWGFPLLLGAAIVVLAPHGRDWGGAQELIAGCWSCIGVTVASAVIPWSVTIVVLKRLAPLWQLRAGLLVGLSAFFFGALVTELHCPDPNAFHVAFAHYVPVTLLSAFGCVFAVALLSPSASNSAR